MSDDPLRPEVLLRVPSEMEGNIMLGLLKDAGIRATLTGSFTSGFRAEAPGEVSVVVRCEDLERARKVVQLPETVRSVTGQATPEYGKPKDLIALFSLVLMLAIAGLWIVFF